MLFDDSSRGLLKCHKYRPEQFQPFCWGWQVQKFDLGRKGRCHVYPFAGQDFFAPAPVQHGKKEIL